MRIVHQAYKRRVAPHTGAWIETPGVLGRVGILQVAPHTGAWIETHRRQLFGLARYVAPHTGAWIETAWQSPMVGGTRVAPHTGAWIETTPTCAKRAHQTSRPIRARGLKRRRGGAGFAAGRSRPIRARGLKPYMRCGRLAHDRRAPYGRVD